MPSNWFLALDGIAGDSNVQGHESELEVGSWNWGLHNQRSPGGGAVVGRPVVGDLVVELSSDAGTLQLVRSCALGQQAAKGSLTGVRAGGQPFTYLQYQMQRITVVSVHQDTRDDGTLRYLVTLQFRGVKATFTPQNPDGSPGTPLQVGVGNVTP
jgi:type VI protein secretion system component Hcp